MAIRSAPLGRNIIPANLEMVGDERRPVVSCDADPYRPRLLWPVSVPYWTRGVLALRLGFGYLVSSARPVSGLGGQRRILTATIGSDLSFLAMKRDEKQKGLAGFPQILQRGNVS